MIINLCYVIYLFLCRKFNFYIDFKIYDIYCINYVIVINKKKIG